MANSGILWIDVVFNYCVRLLYEIAAAIGMTYEEINVYLFVIVGPILLFASIGLNIFLIIRGRKQAYSTICDQ
jgi:hypothetical protein